MDSPFKEGFCDGVMGRPAASPFKDYGRAQMYLKAYMKGQAAIRRLQLNA